MPAGSIDGGSVMLYRVACLCGVLCFGLVTRADVLSAASPDYPFSRFSPFHATTLSLNGGCDQCDACPDNAATVTQSTPLPTANFTNESSRDIPITSCLGGASGSIASTYLEGPESGTLSGSFSMTTRAASSAVSVPFGDFDPPVFACKTGTAAVIGAFSLQFLVRDTPTALLANVASTWTVSAGSVSCGDACFGGGFADVSVAVELARVLRQADEVTLRATVDSVTVSDQFSFAGSGDCGGGTKGVNPVDGTVVLPLNACLSDPLPVGEYVLSVTVQSNSNTASDVQGEVNLNLGIGGAGNGGLNWISAAGGELLDAANWCPSRVPTASDRLLFALPDVYSVAFPEAVASSLRVSDGFVTLGGTLLTLGSTAATPSSIEVDDVAADRAASLLLQAGEYRAGSIAVGIAGDSDPDVSLLELGGDGVRLSATDLIVGEETGSEGLVSSKDGAVEGDAGVTTLKATGSLLVGAAGDGALDLEQVNVDASTSTTGLALAVLAGSTGLVDLAGGVSSFGPAISVGGDGTGTLQLSNGALVDAATLVVGENSLGSGTVAVDGDAAAFGGALHSALSIAGAVSIGKNGSRHGQPRRRWLSCRRRDDTRRRGERQWLACSHPRGRRCGGERSRGGGYPDRRRKRPWQPHCGGYGAVADPRHGRVEGQE
jgi:hypothetical protein